MRDFSNIGGDRPPHTSAGLVASSPTSAKSDALKLRLFFGLLLSVLTFIILMIFSDRLFDPDSFWHIKVGIDIIDSYRLPTTDTYSHTHFGHPWVAKEWLSQILLGLSHKTFGWAGVALLVNTYLALTAFVLFWILTLHVRPSLAIGMTATVMLLCSIIYLARAHVFTFMLAILWTNALFSASAQLRRPCLIIIIILLLWVNLHSSFTLAYFILVFAFFDMIERAGIRNLQLIRQWIIFSILSALISLSHPYGLEAIYATFNVLIDNPFVAVVNEWQPLDVRRDRLFLIVILIVFFFSLATPLRTGISRGSFVTVALFLFIEQKRLVFVFFFLTPVVLAADIARCFPKLSAASWQEEAKEALEGVVLRTFAPIVAGLIAVTVIVTPFLATVAKMNSSQFAATQAIQFVKGNNIQGNVLNSLELGGTLLFHDIKTFVDGRTDQLFLGNFFEEIAASRRADDAAPLRQIIDKYEIDWVFLLRSDPRAQLMGTVAGWSKIYADEHVVVFVPDRVADAVTR